MAESYGQDAAVDLYHWMFRAFVDKRLRRSLLRWQDLLPCLTLPDLPGETRLAKDEMVQDLFNVEGRRHQIKVEAEASSIPLSDEELQLLKLVP